MKRGFFNKLLIAGGMMLTIGSVMLNGEAMATEVNYYENDVTPPWGRVSIVGATEVNNINYVDRQEITVQVYASDDMCEEKEIKYYLSFDAISKTTKIADSDWKSLASGDTTKLTLPSITSTNTIYAMFKDLNGNTSLIYTGTQQTITYDANDGQYAPTGVATTRIIGAPFIVTNQTPEREGYYFLGWSTDKNATVPSYRQGDVIAPDVTLGGGTTVTLYAIWTTEEEGLPNLAEVVKVGDYVNYPVYYDNVATYNNSYTPVLHGWRVLSIEGDTVNLVSAGVPLTYKWSSVAAAVKALAIDFTDISYGTVAGNFIKYGFDPNKSIDEVFDNKYTATYESDTPVEYVTAYNAGTAQTYTGTKEAGDLKVRAMTKEDLEGVYGSKITGTSTYVTDAKFNNLLAIPTTTSTTSNFACYWLASPYSSSSLWYVRYDGRVNYGGSSNYVDGVRPVVSLKSEVLATGTDMIGAWNITIE